MCVLNDKWIFKHGPDIIQPFKATQVNPASYDLRIGTRYYNIVNEREFIIGSGGLTLFPGEFILAETVEEVHMPEDVAGTVLMKSSWARMGLNHLTAGLIDPGFRGKITLEFHAAAEVTLKANSRIVQIVFHKLNEKAVQPYRGKYQGQRGVQPAIF